MLGSNFQFEMVCMDTTVLNQTHTYKSFSNSTNLSILGKYTVLHLINRDNCWLKVKTDVAYDFYFITKLAVHIEFQITLKRTQMWYQLIGIYNREKIQERIWIPLRSKCEDIVNWKQIADFVWYHICKKKRNLQWQLQNLFTIKFQWHMGPPATCVTGSGK